MRRRDLRLPAALLIVAVLVAAAATLFATSRNPSRARPPCSATNGSTTYSLDLAQASSASTIAAIAKRDGLPDHAVTVALAAALQESGLRNLPGGDLDSAGLFQQRPSQGWGTRAQILSPRYASAAFYQRLAQVPDWQKLAVTDAAQAVQRSAAPNAYAQWEAEARVLAETLTGEVPAGFVCRIRTTSPAVASRSAIANAALLELGLTDLAAALAPPGGWVLASWLIGHAEQFHISSLTYLGRRWTASSGSWTASGPGRGTTQIQINGA